MENPLLDFFKTFSDAQRLRLAALLTQEALTIDAIAAQLNMRAVEVPRQLAMIEKLGLLAKEGDRYRLDGKALERLSRQVLAGLRAEQPNDENADDFDRTIVKNYSLPNGRLRDIPSVAKKRVALLRHVAQAFEPGTRYTEKQVNEMLKRYYDDPALLRRYMCDDHVLLREPNGSAYWREKVIA